MSVPASWRREIGQLLIGSLPGTTITAEMRSLAREFSLGGVILFGRNIEAAEQVAELAHDVQQLLRHAAAVGQRRSGGRPRGPAQGAVHRLAADGGARAAAATRRWRARFAAALAAELRAVGITLDYAPVLDIHTNEKNPVIGDRALSADADMVARLGAAIVARAAGQRRRRLRQALSRARRHVRGLAPRAAARRASARPDPPGRVRAVPAAIAAERGVHHDRARPGARRSTRSGRPRCRARIVYDLLRDELGFEGVILSDDLEMKAIAATYQVPDAAVQAMAAGCDGLLICSGDAGRAGGRARGAGARGRTGRPCPSSGSRTR